MSHSGFRLRVRTIVFYWLPVVLLAFLCLPTCIAQHSPLWSRSSNSLRELQSALSSDDLDQAVASFVKQWSHLHSNLDQSTQVRLQYLMAGPIIHEYNQIIENAKANLHNRTRLNLQVVQQSLHSLQPLKSNSNQDVDGDGDDQILEIELSSLDRKRRSSFPEPAPNCSRCMEHEHAKLRRLEEIKSEILSKLSMTNPPPSVNQSLPKLPIIQNLLNQQRGVSFPPPRKRPISGNSFSEESNDDHLMAKDQQFPSSHDIDGEEFYVNAKSSFTFAQAPPEQMRFPSHLNVQYFQFSANLINSQVQNAQLYVYIRPTKAQQLKNDPYVQLIVYQVTGLSSHESPTLMQIRKKEIRINPKQPDWVQVDIRKLLNNWFKQTDKNFGLVVECFDTENNPIDISKPIDSDMSMRTFVVSQHQQSPLNRRRRESPEGLTCTPESKETRCCRFPLTVDFEEFGWDWVVAPKRYEANYCAGDCPYSFLQDYPHTKIIQGANIKNSKICCSARKFSSISMIYFTSEYNLIYGHLPGMVVDRCGCV